MSGELFGSSFVLNVKYISYNYVSDVNVILLDVFS